MESYYKGSLAVIGGRGYERAHKEMDANSEVSDMENEDDDHYVFQKFRIFYVFFFSYYIFLFDEMSVVRVQRGQGRGAAAFDVCARGALTARARR